MGNDNAEQFGEKNSAARKRSSRPKAPKKKNAVSMDELLASAETVSATFKKLDFYRSSGMPAPAALEELLEQQEGNLDERVRSMVAQRPSLLQEVVEDERFSDELLNEIDASYHKAVSFANGVDRARSRLFFLPCVYWSGGATGEARGLIDFSGGRKDALEGMLGMFIEEHFGEAAAVTAHVDTFRDWGLSTADEQNLPKLHQAILAQAKVDPLALFPSLSGINADQEGWSFAILPFTVQHDDEKWLEEFGFGGLEAEFLTRFESIFDNESKLDYDVPCDPSNVTEAATSMLWAKQVTLSVASMSKVKRKSHVGVIETTFAWDEGEFAGVMTHFKVIDPARQSQEEQGIVWQVRLTRPALQDELPRDISGFLLELPELRREDFDLTFNHQLTTD